MYNTQAVVVYCLSSSEMVSETRVQILDEAVCDSYRDNNPEKGIDLSVLHKGNGYIVT